MKGKGVSDVIVKFANPDIDTVSLPGLSSDTLVDLEGDGAGACFNATFNAYNGDQQWQAFSLEQYTIHIFGRCFSGALFKGDPRFTVSGLYPNAAWVRVEVLYGNQEVVSFDASDFETTMLNGRPAPNPFVKGSRTMLGYRDQARCVQQSGRALPGENSRAPVASVPYFPFSRVSCETTNTEVYRVSAEGTEQILQSGDSGSDSGCSSTFLFSPGRQLGRIASQQYQSPIPLQRSYEFTYGFMKFQIPRSFNNFKDLRYKGLLSEFNPHGYDLQHFSVTSYFVGPNPNLPWSVNSLMLAAQARESPRDRNVAYLLFAPVEEVKSIQKPGATTPPVVWLPGLKRKAYVLQAPNWLWIFEYQTTGSCFRGDPARAKCYTGVLEGLLHPATCDELGPYKPQIVRLDHVSNVPELVEAMDKLT